MGRGQAHIYLYAKVEMGLDNARPSSSHALAQMLEMGMIKINWHRFVTDYVWFGWYYYGGEQYGLMFAKSNRIFWNRVMVNSDKVGRFKILNKKVVIDLQSGGND